MEKNILTQLVKNILDIHTKACSQKWWNTHLYLVDRSSKALYHFTCPTCGKQFTAYGNPNRKYCSHERYIDARYYREPIDER